MSLLIRGGIVVDGDGLARADVLLEDERILAVGDLPPAQTAGARILEADGRLVVPGFVDAHSHAEGAIFDEEVQQALLRQGITSVIGGQDGVSYAPGDGAHASEYFAAINGPHPAYRGSRVADLLASYDGRIPLNVAYLVPAGTVRHEVMGPADAPADATQRDRMAALVAEGLADGAVGLSTGLDYTPGLFADAEEIAALCAPLAGTDLPYVTHMRGGYEDNSQVGIEEVARIGDSAGVPVHISHFHTRAEEARRLMALLEERGVEASFDAYPYTRGCSLLAMSLLPPALNALAPEEAAARLRDGGERERLRREWFPRVDRYASLGPAWPELMTIGHTPAPEFADAHGLTLAELARRRGTDPIDAALDLLSASRLAVNVVMAVPHQRSVEDLGRLIAHPRHLGGSDGIFIGAHPHPRARGTFASYLATFVRERGDLDWPAAVRHLSTGPVDRFRLGARGRLRPGHLADLALVDPEAVRDMATYDDPTAFAVGIDDVLVGGRPVLAGGQLTGDRPGGGLRAAPATPQGLGPAASRGDRSAAPPSVRSPQQGER
ncbi:amidohydrolase family protein [Brachybacterium sp. YJGR34]|uniref:N-acyl-D-amino-acid deacylase family protein n=1 Tax=Brachybacterium sp. YJGR34 TaxID=2059911 RepID=UPI000E0B3131|nr:amidohydrolase family protein [Brachybacterium sp. YJGR34]